MGSAMTMIGTNISITNVVSVAPYSTDITTLGGGVTGIRVVTGVVTVTVVVTVVTVGAIAKYPIEIPTIRPMIKPIIR